MVTAAQAYWLNRKRRQKRAASEGVGVPAWVLSGAALDLNFSEAQGYNSLDRAKLTPDSILTYTAPSPKLVYGADGVLRYAPHNLIRYSQELDNATWLKTGTGTGSLPVVTANASIAPDGTATAYRIDFDRGAGNTASDQSQINQQFTGTLPSGFKYVASFYVKASDAGNVGKVLAYRTVSAAGYSTVSLTDEWQRLTLEGTGIGGTQLIEFNSRGTSGADNVLSADLWGVQVSNGVTVFDYIPTTSAARYSLPLDHDPITFDPLGVLIEEQRTNLLTYSEQFDNAAYTKGAASVTANAIAAPDGTTTADKLVEDGTLASHFAFQTASSVTSGTTYTQSVYAKAAERTWLRIFLGANVGNGFAWINLATGAVGTTSGSPTVAVTDVGNGWYRIAVSKAATGTGATSISFLIGTSDGVDTYTGNGTSGIYLWGAQLEAGAFPTSYIPTVASQVTRAADQVSILTSAFGYNASEGTLFADFTWRGAIGSHRVASLNDGTSADRIEILTNGGNSILGSVTDGGVSQAALAGSLVVNTPAQVAMAYKINDFALSKDGAAVVTDASGTIPTVNNLQLSRAGGGANIESAGHIKRLTYFPTRKSNAELQALAA